MDLFKLVLSMRAVLEMVSWPSAKEPAKQTRDLFIESFEARLGCALTWALVIGLMHVLSKFVDLCLLYYITWFLLRSPTISLDLSESGHLSSLATGLIFVGAARYAITSFIMRLLVHPLAFESQAPPKIRHDSKDDHYRRSRSAHGVSNGLQSFFIILYLILIYKTCTGYDCTHDYSIRYLVFLAIISTVVGSITLVLSLIALVHVLSKSPAPQQSISRYYDTVLERAITSGLMCAHDSEFFRFAYTMLGGEFSRNVQPETVAKNHADLIKYLYYHRVGSDFLQIFLDDKDAWVQLAAVNILGFWVDKTWEVGLGESNVKLPRELPKKLADKVGMGQVGWAAVTSIGVLAASSSDWRKTLVQTSSSSGKSLPGVLVDSIDVNSNRSLAIVRALLPLMHEQLCPRDVEKGPPEPFTKEEYNSLMGKLKTLAEEARVHRLRARAAYLLLSLSMSPPACDDSTIFKRIVEKIDPTKDDYWFDSEMEMLNYLYMLCIDRTKYPPSPKVLKPDHKLERPWWLKPIEKSPSRNSSAGKAAVS